MIAKRDVNERIDVSFCIPVYNAKDFLRDCIYSIEAQRLSESEIFYEIVCVDDCSTDGSYDELLQLSNEYSCVKVLKNEKNRGISYTRNRLIKEAKGKYIWYVDADDMLFSNCAKRVFEEAERVKADVLYCNYIRVPEGIKGNESYHFNVDKVARLVKDKEDIPCDDKKVNMNALWACLFLKDFLIEKNLSFNEKVHMQEDSIFFWAFKHATDKIWKIDTPVYIYRQRKVSITHNVSEEVKTKRYLSMIEKLQIYQKWMEEGYYSKKKIIKRKVLLTRQGIVLGLASLNDDDYVADELKRLRELKVYPYPLCWYSFFTAKENVGLKFLRLLLPFEKVFWLYHKIYKRKKLNGEKQK